MKTAILILLLTTFSYGQSPDLIFTHNGKAVYQKGGKFGVSSNPNKINYEYDSIVRPRLENYLFALKKDNWGVIDFDNRIIVPFNYEMITKAWAKTKSGNDIFIVQNRDLLGTVDDKNSQLLPLKYEAISGWCENGPEAHYVKENGKIGIVDYQNEVVIPTLYHAIHYYSDEIIKAKIDEKFGLLNKKNEIEIPFEYDAMIIDYNYVRVDPEKKDQIVVRNNGNWMILDVNGDVIQKGLSDSYVKKEYAQFQLTNYDFDYTVECMIEPIKTTANNE